MISIALFLALSASDPQQVAVAPLKANGVLQDLGNKLAEVLAVEVEKFEGIDVISPNDLRSVLDQAANAQLMGCEEPQCFVDVARFVPARRLLSGSLSKVGATLYVEATLIDLEQARVIARAGAP